MKNSKTMNYEVKRIQAKLAKEYIHKNHYSHGSHNAPSPCYGLFDNDNLIGVCMFATPCSENVRSSLFGKAYKDKVIELHRLHILDVTPKNTESWFLSRVFDLLQKDRSNTKGIIAFSDITAGHKGTIYKATNALYLGRTAKATFYLDETGRLRHPRQNGINITKEKAKELGWSLTRRDGKYRYVWIIGNNKADRKYWRKKLIREPLPYE